MTVAVPSPHVCKRVRATNGRSCTMPARALLCRVSEEVTWRVTHTARQTAPGKQRGDNETNGRDLIGQGRWGREPGYGDGNYEIEPPNPRSPALAVIDSSDRRDCVALTPCTMFASYV
ncbi:hypothetical protein Bbelb_236900 [Branchiostoma belcheri]|nr:hypothetical protein Bbelb_236900 [Branchiostoma belcheri]